MKIPDVDLETGIIHGVLKQVRCDINDIDFQNPPLIAVWSCEIPPSSTKNFLSFIKACITPYDPQLFVHIKRLQKIEQENGTDPLLRCIICSQNFISSQDDLRKFIESNSDFQFDDINVQEVYIPRDVPPTKDIGNEWSLKYWPMAWKGNTNHQFLKSVKVNVSEERRMVQTILNEIKTLNANDNPSVTIIAKISSKSYEILSVNRDNRQIHPLEHSVMLGIKGIANTEKERRIQVSNIQNNENNYLCHDLVVFTSLEPCVMCCMALLHSRIGKLVYMKDTNTGALGSNYQLGDREGLNWKFEIWKWIGNENNELDKLIPEANLNINY